MSKIDDDIEQKKYIYEQACQCYNQCLILDKNQYKINKEAPICNKISLENISIDTSLELIGTSLEYLKNRRYIKQIITENNKKYYITTNKSFIKFNWQNIKALNLENIKELFWLFRKLIVDNILKIIIKENSILNKDYLNVKIYSVGSTNITSDYDITLYSDSNYIISNIITQFSSKFIDIFGEHNSTVFDTNIYGKSYIVFDKNIGSDKNTYTEINKESCKNQSESFYYINSLNNTKYKYTQVVWSLIKFLRDMSNAFDSSICSKYLDFLKNKCDNRILDVARETLVFLDNIDTNYCLLIEDQDVHKLEYNQARYSELLFENDYVSLINFYGEETYFTRGAFLDTVVNSQMCQSSAIVLYEEDYIASILENTGFYFLHNDKTKYLKRIKMSLLLLINLYKYLEIKNLKEFEILIEVSNDKYDYCNWIDKDDFDLLKCDKYKMFQVLLKIIYKILYIYLKDLTFTEFPFHHLYIENKLGDLMSPSKKTTLEPININFNIERRSRSNTEINKYPTSPLNFK